MDKHPDSEIIDRLGGTGSVAKLCKVKPPSVSQWRTTGIPAARRQLLELVRPDAFAESNASAKQVA
jgi:DNA-binding transcriptional regulator YdaS (Cro superfamily)